MTILLLGRPDLQEFLSQNAHVEFFSGEQARAPLSLHAVRSLSPDWIISHGYRFKLGREILDYCPGRTLNLHISYLPYNRGADPNFWSWLHGTPKGVTIHQMDEGIDTGPILTQRAVKFTRDDHTLRSSYEMLQQEICKLFRERWPEIRGGSCTPTPQGAGGSTHKTIDRAPYEEFLSQGGWDTPVSQIEEYGGEIRQSADFWERIYLDSLHEGRPS